MLESSERRLIHAARPERFLDHPQQQVSSGAAAGLLATAGLENFRDRILERQEDGDADGVLTPEQRRYIAVSDLDGEIGNGGFSQYFMNSSGNEWPDAIAGFAELGMPKRLAIVKEAIAVFGGNEPSTNREQRQQQLSRIYRKNEVIFSEMENRYYACTESIDACAARYVLAHPDAFR